MPCIDRAIPLLAAACLTTGCLGANTARTTTDEPSRPAAGQLEDAADQLREVDSMRATTMRATASVSQLEALEDFAGRLNDLDSTERERQYRELLVQLDAAPFSIDKALRVSLLLSDPRTPYYAPNDALALLEDATQTNARGNSADGALVRLFHRLLSKHTHVNSQYLHEISELRAELATEQQLRLDLEVQLNALKAVEQRSAVDDPAAL